MNRRAFLAGVTAAVGGLMLDPERLLWVPGRKSILDLGTSVPVELDSWTTLVEGLLKPGDIVTIQGVYELNPIIWRRNKSLREFIVTHVA